MATIPASVLGFPKVNGGLSVQGFMTGIGFPLEHRGKVRDTYGVPKSNDQMAVVASDRISIFDFVLPALVPSKGEVLTALTHFWITQILKPYATHLRQMPGSNFNFAIRFAELWPGFPATRTLVVERLHMQTYELIFRRHLGGSVWGDYQRTGFVSGLRMPEGLQKWQQLEEAIFTPSTKAEVGHDVNIDGMAYAEHMGSTGANAVEMLRSAYSLAYNIARERGVLILDTKFEVGQPLQGSQTNVIGDEVLTPDSSRFTTEEDFGRAMAENRDPVFYDKEPVRNWGRTVETPFGVIGINNLKPENPDHVDFVGQLQVPSEVVADCSQRYQTIFHMLTGQPLRRYQREHMGVVAA